MGVDEKCYSIFLMTMMERAKLGTSLLWLKPGTRGLSTHNLSGSSTVSRST